MRYFAILLVLTTLFSCTKTDKKIYQWRGENRNGIFQETKLLKQWSKNGPKEIWSVDNIGNGYCSPIIAGNEIFITGELDSMAVLFCLDLQGQIKWKQKFWKEWIRSFPGSRSSPTVVGNLIYVGSGMGNLYCIKRENGEVVWSKDFTNDFQGQYPYHGHSDAAVISGNKVFWVPGGEKYNVVALNRFNGELIWNCKGLSERSAYTQSNLITIPNRQIFITFTAYSMIGIDAETGEHLWTHKQNNTPLEKRRIGIGDTHSNAPIYEDGSIYYCEGDGNCGVKLSLSDDGSEISEIWKNQTFDGFMGGIVKIGNFIYGSGTARKELFSINATTGQLTDSLKIGSGALIAADKMLYYYNQRGILSLIKYDHGKLIKISSFRIKKGTNQHFSHPVINKGVLYQRHGNILMAFDIKEK